MSKRAVAAADARSVRRTHDGGVHGTSKFIDSLVSEHRGVAHSPVPHLWDLIWERSSWRQSASLSAIRMFVAGLAIVRAHNTAGRVDWLALVTLIRSVLR